jgi:hypothetical protein
MSGIERREKLWGSTRGLNSPIMDPATADLSARFRSPLAATRVIARLSEEADRDSINGA